MWKRSPQKDVLCVLRLAHTHPNPRPHMHACNATQRTHATVKQKEMYSVLRVMSVVLERLPSVFANGAQHTALLKLLQLLAEPSAYHYAWVEQ